jgi:hypothetical protein
VKSKEQSVASWSTTQSDGEEKSLCQIVILLMLSSLTGFFDFSILISDLFSTIDGLAFCATKPKLHVNKIADK